MSKSVIKTLIVLSAALIAAGCATPYQKSGATGGFSEIQLDTNVWQVTFQGNGAVSPQKASEYALLRCAELTLEKGYSFFGLTETKNDSQQYTYVNPTQTTTKTKGYSTDSGKYGQQTESYTTGGDTVVIVSPSTINTVMMFKDKPNINGMIYDAKLLCKSLGEKYKASVTCDYVAGSTAPKEVSHLASNASGDAASAPVSDAPVAPVTNSAKKHRKKKSSSSGN